MNPIPVVLYGDRIRLEPLDHRHADALFDQGRSAEIWRYLPAPMPESVGDVISLVDEAWRAAADGRELPFAVIDERTDRAVGSTRYLDIRRSDRALEIGWTWYAPPTQGTLANMESKFLLLRHAFEELGAIRVQFRTDSRNGRSVRAIERLGATREGVLRQERRARDGIYRDTVVYSIIETEWAAVKERLRRQMSMVEAG
jgi:RimJ/RimL family protein N-acetyltransferase